MKLATILILTASVIYSSWAFPAGGHPDDDAEVLGGGSGVIPNYPRPSPQPPSSPPSLPAPVPNYPVYPNIPTFPTVPVYPSYPYPSYPTYPTYPTYVTPTFFPVGWSYNVYNGLTNFVQHLRNQASTAWSSVPSIRPLINRYWPDVKTNGTTTSTVKVVGDHKFIINETVHVQQSDFGHVIFKVRTVDVKPNVETTEGASDDETTTAPEADIDEPSTTEIVSETENDEDDDRVSVLDSGDIDEIGSPELLGNSNHLAFSELEDFEGHGLELKDPESADSSEEANEIKKESLSTVTKAEKIDIESLSSEPADQKSNEWADIELENSDDHQNTYYEVNNNDNSNEEQVTQNLLHDIEINQMLADQGATHNPDAEVFDINQYDFNRDISGVSAHEDKEPQQESFDYLPYYHRTDKRPSIVK